MPTTAAQSRPVERPLRLRTLLISLRTRVTGSQRITDLSLKLTHHTGIVLTPGIAVRHGEQLTHEDHAWIREIVTATAQEDALLVVNESKIETAIHDDRVIVAFDRLTGAFAGCLFPWRLTDDAAGYTWTEIGTIYVPPAFRFRRTRLRICEKLLAMGIRRRELHDEMVMMTTTNPVVVHHGVRQGMQVIPFTDLPPEVHAATCCCPTKKTGAPSVADNPAHCTQRDITCRCIVSASTARALVR